MNKRYRAVLVGVPSRSDTPWSTFVADDDADAVVQVQRLLGASSAFDLYQDQRLVRRHRSPRPDPSAARDRRNLASGSP